MTIADEVLDALSDGRGRRAGEHDPRPRPARPDNRRIGAEIEDAVRACGAVPATVAVLDGVVHVGWSRTPSTGSVSPTTSSSSRSAILASRWRWVGPGRRRWPRAPPWPISPASGSSPPAGSAACTVGGADLRRLRGSRRAQPHPVLTVCAGVKSILDVAGTLGTSRPCRSRCSGTARTPSRLLPHRLRLPRPVAGRHPAGGRRGARRPGPAGRRLGRDRPGQPAAAGPPGRPGAP